VSFYDIIILIIIGGFGFVGYYFGFVSTLGSILGSVLGIYLSTRYYEGLAQWLMKITGWTGNFPIVVSLIILFLVFNRLLGFIFWLSENALKLVTELPIIFRLNKILGFILGLFEGVLVIGVIVFFINKFPLGWLFMDQLARSRLALYSLGIASFLWPLVPNAINEIQDSITNWLIH
jgi:uncharacterized membrane protein required for colicin V production